MEVAIIGTGYVGLVAAACFAELGHTVICVDSDERKVNALNAGECIIHEEHLPELLARHRHKNLSFTTSLSEAVRASRIVFIAVGTPPMYNGEADLSMLEAVCRDIAAEVADQKLVVVKSTVPVGTNAWIRRVMNRYGAPEGLVDVASNPEFLREGTAVTDFLYPDRILIGSDFEESSDILRSLYEPILDGSYALQKNALPMPKDASLEPKLVQTSTRSAELIKHSANAFLAMKISFVNAIANVCECTGADVQEVCEGIGTDVRIGNRFLNPGIGYGGSCFPKDLTALRSVSKECGYEFRLLDEVIRVNEQQRNLFLSKVRSALWNLRGKRLAVLGLAFKGGTDDIRESPAISMINMLLKEGCEVVAYDPAAMDRAKAEISHVNMRFANSPYEAATGANALLILTDWAEFGRLDLDRVKDNLRNPIVIDGRNMYSLEEMEKAGFVYYSVGRKETSPKVVFTKRAAASDAREAA